jgi:hypothetical protein
VDSTGVGGGVAADGAGALAGWVGGEMQARSAGEGGDGFGKLGVPHAGLDVCGAIGDVDLENLVHPRGGDDHAAVESNASTSQPGAGAAWDDLHIVLAQEFYDLDDLRGGGREHHSRRAGLGDGESVAFVDEQFGGITDNGVIGEKRAKFADESLGHARIPVRAFPIL